MQRIEEFVAQQLTNGLLNSDQYKLVAKELHDTAGYSWESLYDVYQALSQNPVRCSRLAASFRG